MTGGAHHNMVGTYKDCKDWILANAKVVYGPSQSYDVVYSSGSTHSSGQDVRTAYLVAWHATDKRATLLLTNNGTCEILYDALSQLNADLAELVALAMDIKREDDAIDNFW